MKPPARLQFSEQLHGSRSSRLCTSEFIRYAAIYIWAPGAWPGDTQNLWYGFRDEAGNQAKYAYQDSPLRIGYGQTISQPYMVAFMTEVIRSNKNFRVLEIGTGSGYQAATLAEIVDSVFTIEIVEELGKIALNRLKKLGYNNVSAKIGDGYQGWREKGPFNAIVVTAAAEHIPQPLIDQLKEGGRMVIPIGAEAMTQRLVLMENKQGKVYKENLMNVRFVPFTRPDEH